MSDEKITQLRPGAYNELLQKCEKLTRSLVEARSLAHLREKHMHNALYNLRILLRLIHESTSAAKGGLSPRMESLIVRIIGEPTPVVFEEPLVFFEALGIRGKQLNMLARWAYQASRGTGRMFEKDDADE